METDCNSIEYPGHCHPLHLHEISRYGGFKCNRCYENVHGPARCCFQCEFFLHASCADFPSELQHPLHSRHLLVFVRSSELRCSGCNCKRCSEFYFSCDQCSFYLDLDCAFSFSFLPEAARAEDLVSNQVVVVSHHHHPMIRCSYNNKKPYRQIRCHICDECIKGEIYGCVDCRFYIHEKCGGLPQNIHHPSHTRHPLNLAPLERGTWYDESFCDACSKPYHRGYGCNYCDYNLHVDCAALALSMAEDNTSLVNHFSHQHFLLYIHAKEKTRIRCKLCMMNILGDTYTCLGCSFYIHKRCAELQRIMQHNLHPHHFLALEPSDNRLGRFRCNGCQLTKADGFRYRCTHYNGIPAGVEADTDQTCQYTLDLACAIQTLSFHEMGLSLKIQTFPHKHPLTLCYIQDDGANCDPRCGVCEGSVSNSPAYCCTTTDCSFWLDISCAKQPLVIQKHRLCRDYPLKLTNASNGELNCSVCCKKIEAFGFSCMEGSFHLHWHCASEGKAIKHPRHEHYLVYIARKKHLPLHCNFCGKSCNFDFYECFCCTFRIHYFCLPLPQEVKSHEHVHPLYLHDRFLEDDTGQYYCALCGERRDPDQGIYYCKLCELTAHIECVVPSKVTKESVLLDLDREIADLEQEYEANRINVVKMEKLLEKARIEAMAVRKKLESSMEKRRRIEETKQSYISPMLGT